MEEQLRNETMRRPVWAVLEAELAVDQVSAMRAEQARLAERCADRVERARRAGQHGEMRRWTARDCWSAGARGRPISTGLYTRASITPICAPARQSIRSSSSSARSRSRMSPARWPSSIQPTVDRSSALPAANEIRHRHVFALAVALGGAGLGLTVTSLIATLVSVHHASPGSDRVVLAGIQLTYPRVNGAGAVLLALGLLGAGVLAVAIRGV